MGKNMALSENIGHTYKYMGEYDSAERYFKEALQLTQSLPPGTESNQGGILLGLAGVQHRRGALKDSLVTSRMSYEFYRDRDVKRGWESSLTAKAAMQLCKVHMDLGQLTEAEGLAREAVRLFEVTAGDDSPLVAGALERLGSILVKLGRQQDARRELLRAYELESIKDAFDLVGIMEIHNKLVDTHLSAGGLDRAAFRRYFEVSNQVVTRVRTEMTQDGNAGAYYKIAGELRALGGDCASARPLLAEAKQLFVEETSIDTSGLVQQCADLIAYCDGTYQAPGNGKVTETKTEA